jgi:hypothetical protein
VEYGFAADLPGAQLWTDLSELAPAVLGEMRL